VALELPDAEKSRTIKNPLVMLPSGSEAGGTTVRSGGSKGVVRTNGAVGAPRPAGGNRRGGT
jgi:hypothetical protein